MTSALRGFLIRLGVVACVAVSVGTAALKLDDALGIFDLRADLNAASTYSERTHTHREWSASAGDVLETARLRMPEDARYRVVFTPAFDASASADFTHQLLPTLLLPRRPTASEDAEWLFCYGCDESTFDERFQVIAQVEGGPMFGQARP